MIPIRPRLVAREPPLPPVGVAVERRRWPNLLERLTRADGSTSSWTLALGKDLAVVLGDEPPWLDGALFLGREGPLARLLLPTMIAFDVPLTLVERALASRHGFFGTAALLVEPVRVVALAPPLAIDDAVLRTLREKLDE